MKIPKMSKKMSNGEASSSHAIAVYNQDRSEPFLEKSIPAEYDPATEYLLNLVGNQDGNDKFSPIYMVPDILRNVNTSSFIPRVVSIGPLHKGRRNLKSVESKKPKYLKELLLKVCVDPLKETLDNCVKRVRSSIQEIKRSYFGMKDDYSDDQLVQMMVMDGCYILRFIDNLSEEGISSLDNPLRRRNIALDLVLLENQIPYFVLKGLYNLTVQRFRPGSDLTTMIKVLLDYINPFEQPLHDGNFGANTTDHYHILGLLHKFYKPYINFELKVSAIPRAHSAVELDDVGVKILRNKSLNWPMEMEFKHYSSWHKPKLKMPVVRVDNFFEVVLRNLIAYEQYSPVDNYVTSYAMAMHMLVATPADIAKLGKSGVIISHLGSNEAASIMISSICKNVNLQDFYYMESWENMVKYCDGHWFRNVAVFKGTYINTPWKAIALLAAIIVFLITVYQFFRQQNY